MSTTRVVHVSDNVPGAVYVGRRNNRLRLPASPLANPFPVQQYGLVKALWGYRRWLESELLNDPNMVDAVIACRNRPLACFCRHDGETATPNNACHGDFIIAVLDEFTDEELRAMHPSAGESA